MTSETQDAAAPARRLRGHVITALVLFTLDGFCIAQGVMTALIGLGMVVIGFVHIGLGVGGRNRTRFLHGIQVITIYVALGGAVFGIIHVNNRLARQRANRIVDALKAYKAKYGLYPTRLADLVPAYIPDVPLAKYTLLFNEFRYSYHADIDDGLLMYTALPPFGRPTYRLKTETWGYLD